MFKSTQNFLILIAAIALLFSACSMQSNLQSAMQVELEQKQELAEFVCNEHNNAEACFVVGGWLFERGINTIDDNIKQNELLDKGQKYLLKSCDLNHGDGCFVYAMASMWNVALNDFKQGVKNDLDSNFSKAYDNKLLTAYMKYIKKSCELGSAKGCETLGDSYWNGNGGLKRDENQAFFYRKKGCDLAQTNSNQEMIGNVNGVGCAKVGLMYYNGYGVVQNKKLALEYFYKSCAVSGYHCGIYIQNFYEGYSSKYTQVPRDYGFAFKLAQRGCEANDGASCNYLGILYQEGKGTNQDSQKAFRVFQKLCYEKTSGNDIFNYQKTGCYNLALSYANGQGVEQNYKRAFGIFKDLCDKDKMASACGIVGECYYNAKGVRQDYREALKYFSVACDMGEQSGCDNHKMMKQSPYAHGLRKSDFR